MAGTGMVGPSHGPRVVRSHSGHDDDRCGSQRPGAPTLPNQASRLHNSLLRSGGWSHTTAGRGRGPWPLSKSLALTPLLRPWAVHPVASWRSKCPARAASAAAGSGSLRLQAQLPSWAGLSALPPLVPQSPLPDVQLCGILQHLGVLQPAATLDLWMFYWL